MLIQKLLRIFPTYIAQIIAYLRRLVKRAEDAAEATADDAEDVAEAKETIAGLLIPIYSDETNRQLGKLQTDQAEVTAVKLAIYEYLLSLYADEAEANAAIAEYNAQQTDQILESV